ncbi:hypothetical protein UlMin_040199 [Ulmus minor]
MESVELAKKVMKVEIPSETEAIVGGGGAAVGLTSQTSVNKNNNCLCSPTTHAGSFRCRLHRSPSLQRTKSMDAKPHANVNTTTNAQ